MGATNRARTCVRIAEMYVGMRAEHTQKPHSAQRRSPVPRVAALARPRGSCLVVVRLVVVEPLGRRRTGLKKTRYEFSRTAFARTPLSVFNICFSVQSMKRQTQQTERLGNTYMATSRTCAATIDGRATRACETICVRTCNCLQGKSSDGVLHNVCDDNDRRGVLLQVARRDDVVHPHGNLGELEREKYP